MKTSAAQFHSFNVELAAKFGVHEAILIHHFQYWINHNKALRRHEHDGRTWTYQTRQEIAAWFPYLSHKQVERLTDKLVAVGVLRKGNFAKNQHNRALWYAFEDEDGYVTSPRHFPKSGNGNDEIGKCTLDTDTVTEAKQEREGAAAPKPPAPPASPSKQSYGGDGNVKLTDEEYAKLHDEIGEPETTELIEDLDGYIASTGKRYKSHYATIRNWHRKAKREGKKRSPWAKSRRTEHSSQYDDLF